MFEIFKALRTTLDDGKDLGIPDGVLINGKGPYQYNNTLVPDGIAYETITVDPGIIITDAIFVSLMKLVSFIPSFNGDVSTLFSPSQRNIYQFAALVLFLLFYAFPCYVVGIGIV